jgi:hypothetical protein
LARLLRDGRTDLFPNGVLGHPHSPGDLAVAQPLRLEALDQADSLGGEPTTTWTPPGANGKRGHASLGVALLMTSDRPFSAPEGTCHLHLSGEARVHEEHHRVRLSDSITVAVVMDRKT